MDAPSMCQKVLLMSAEDCPDFRFDPIPFLQGSRLKAPLCEVVTHSALVSPCHIGLLQRMWNL